MDKSRRRQAAADPAYKRKLLHQVQELPSHHRKAAIRALRAAPTVPGPQITFKTAFLWFTAC